MKLRIGANSVRLRLRRSDVDQLAETGEVAETVTFGPVGSGRFSYALRTDPLVPEIQASYAADQLIIGVPQEIADAWIRTEEVGIGGQIPIGNGDYLEVLIEKDFPCKRSGSAEDRADLFGELSQKGSC